MPNSTQIKLATYKNMSSYRVSRKTGNAFVFWISRLPRGLEISSWTFFNSPFHVDFKSIRDFIIWLNLDQDIVKIRQGTLLKSWHFWFSTGSSTWALWITHQHSWAILRVHEHSWALIGTHSQEIQKTKALPVLQDTLYENCSAWVSSWTRK